MVITKVVLEKANRLYQLPPGLLSFMRAEERRGLLKRDDLVDLAAFNWPVPIPEGTLDGDALTPANRDELAALREEIAGWMQTRHGCRVLPDKEIFVGGSITSLLTMLGLAFLDHGDIAFVPELAVPSYRQAITSAGAEPAAYPMSAKTDWLPDFERLGTRVGRVARLAFVNSPHNPTGAELSEQAMANLIWTASREHILVVNDAAYQSIAKRRPVSLLAASGGSKVGVELYSFAYTFGLPRLPYGFVVGNREAISTLKQAARLMPTTIPTGYCNWIIAAIRAFPNEALRNLQQQLARTADRASTLLQQLSLEGTTSGTTPYLWARVPERRNAAAFARQLYRRHRILTIPGTDFGDSGEGYLRLTLSCGEAAYDEAIVRVKKKRLLRKKKKESS
ncbi:aminotransferase class I/II-fold pyridoxal phosphate-dependent enzyme [candidate division GN15 bacterium]|nr:aminotransferase class I/II-fold pyridoxal phosphate-dependent enzyme [candidate division GN15 bacterium]